MAKKTIFMTINRMRVVRGAKWLDDNYPSWLNIIDAKNLRMNDDNWCIGGQLDKYYNPRNTTDWKRPLINVHDLVRYGFRHDRADLFIAPFGWDLLTWTWKREIRHRRRNNG